MTENEVVPNDLIRQACTEMTAYLAAMLTRASYDPLAIVQAGEAIFGWSISTSENAEFLLSHRLDLTIPKSGHPQTLAKATDAYTAHFASGQYDGCFSEILEAYIDFVTWRGDVPTTRALFKAPKDHEGILNILADLGYLQISDYGFLWADKVGQAMLFAGAWSPDFQSNGDIREIDRENLAREIADNLSNDLVVLARSNPEAAFMLLMKSLKHGPWYQEDVDKLVVERIIEIVYSSARHSKTALN